MIGINKAPIVDDLETIFAHVQAGISPKAIGRGEIIAVIVQVPLTNPDGTSNNSELFVGSGSNQIYFMIPGQESPVIYAEDLKDIYVKLKFPFPNPNGGILTAGISTPGTGYIIGDVLTLPKAGGTPATITVTLINKGRILTFGAGGAAGAGYLAGDVVTVNTGTPGHLASVLIQNVGGAGEVTVFTLTGLFPQGGLGYTPGVKATTGGTGAGFTVDVATVSADLGILSFNITTPGVGFSPGELVAATGGSGAGAIIAVDTVETVIAETSDITLLIYRLRKGGKQ